MSKLVLGMVLLPMLLVYESATMAEPARKNAQNSGPDTGIRANYEEIFSLGYRDLFLQRLVHEEVTTFEKAIEAAKKAQAAKLAVLGREMKLAQATIRELGRRPPIEQSMDRLPAATGGIEEATEVTLERAIVRGVLQFVRKRANEEALNFVLEEVRVRICGNPDAQKLLPSFCSLLVTMKTSQWVAPLAILLPALRSDLERFPEHVLDVLGEGEHMALRCALGFANGLQHDLVSTYSVSPLAAVFDTSLASEECVVGLLGSASNKETFMRAVIFSRIALGATREHLSKASELGPSGLAAYALDDLLGVLPKSGGFELAARRLLVKSQAESNELKALLPPTSDVQRREFEQAWAQIETLENQLSVVLEEQTREVTQLVSVLHDTVRKRLRKRLLRISRSLVSLEMRLRRLDRIHRQLGAEGAQPEFEFARIYEEAGMLLIELLGGEDGLPEELRPVLRGVSNLAKGADALKRQKYAVGISYLLSTGLFTDVKGLDKVLPMIELLVGLAEAENSGDVSELIENAALPVGSWRKKRKAPTVGIAGQFGVSGGIDYTDGDKAGLMGAYIPLGLDLSAPWNTTYTYGLLVQIVDLGALTSTRLLDGNDEVEREARYKVSSIFAPGVHAYLGLGDTPFVLGVGADVAPTLRSTSTAGSAAALRMRLALTVDLPIFMF